MKIPPLGGLLLLLFRYLRKQFFSYSHDLEGLLGIERHLFRVKETEDVGNKIIEERRGYGLLFSV